VFDHEKLDGYRVAIDFIAWTEDMLDALPKEKRTTSAARHLEDASTSIALNIAEGNGKRSTADRVRYLEIARGSALECAACLDVLVVRRRLLRELAEPGKGRLSRVVSILTKLIESLLERPSTSTSTSTSTMRRR
jgi:four helix bundle protein